jgi:hypothetical protein
MIFARRPQSAWAVRWVIGQISREARSRSLEGELERVVIPLEILWRF